MSVKAADKPRVRNAFQSLAREWKKACSVCSSTSAMTSHPAYQAIIELGPAVVPLLLEELAHERVHWFEALQAITGEDPVPPADWGNIPAMCSAWLAWGRSRHLL